MKKFPWAFVALFALFYATAPQASNGSGDIQAGSGGSAANSNYAWYAMTCGVANTTSGNSNTATYAQTANVANFALGGNVTYAANANQCSFAVAAGNASGAQNANLCGAANTATFATTSGVSNSTSGNANTATYAQSANICAIAQGGNVNYAQSAGSAAQAANATFATSAGSSQTALQCGNANTAAQAANANFATVAGSSTGNAATATQCGNANTATYSLNSNLAVYSQNANLCTYSSNSNVAMYATSAVTANSATSCTNATSASSATNVTSGGNVATNQVVASLVSSPQFTTANNVLYMGPAGSPNALAIASYADSAFSTTEIGLMVPARVNANAANFNSGIMAFGAFDANHAGLVGQAPNAAAATGFTGGSLLLRTGDDGSVNAPYMQAGAYYVPAAGPYHAQNGGTAANPVFQMCNTVVAGAYTQCNGIHSSTGSGLLYLDANSTTVATLGGATNSAAFAGPLSANNITGNQNVSVAGQILLPNSGGGNSSSIYFGPRDATGVQIFRLTTGIIGFSLGDASGNAQVYASSFKSLNQGTAAAPQIAYSNAAGYGIHWDSTHIYLDANSAITASFDSTGTLSGTKRLVVSKTGAYTLVTTSGSSDSAKGFNNIGATATVPFTVPACTAANMGFNARFNAANATSGVGFSVTTTGTDTIVLAGVTGTNKTTLTTTTQGSVVDLECETPGLWTGLYSGTFTSN